MSNFAVVRHPDIATPGIVPAAALEQQRARGWVRVSDLRNEPADFHLADFADTFDDLDAEPEPEPKAAKTKAATTKESSE
jgi:hypothetical protein